MTLKKHKLMLGVAVATLSVAGALVAPQALADSKAERAAEAANRKVDALESQLRAMQDEMASIRAQAAAPHAAADSAKVQELDQWMNSVKNAPVQAKTKDNMVFFRGGYNRLNDKRGGSVNNNGLGGIDFLDGVNGPRDAWYFGAGFDFSLNDNLFGFADKTEVAAELLVDYKQFAGKTQNLLTGGYLKTNQLTVGASPKIKFFKGSALRPWLIPAGFELNVVSPPTGAVTVLNPGLQFGAGLDYKIWKDLYAGADVRYHLATGTLDGVNLNGVSAGGYLGIGF